MPTANAPAEGGSRYQAGRRVTLIAAGINLFLAVIKFAGGVFAHSQALIADAIDSTSDLFSDMAVLYGARQGSRAPDTKHPYGHGRVETLVSVFLGTVLLATAAGISLRAAQRLLDPAPILPPAPAALAVAVIAIALKEWIYRYTLRVGRETRSRMLEANAWHQRTDSISSLVVLLGVGGSLLGMPYLDPVAAIGVSVLIARVGWELLWQSVSELTDASLSRERVAAIRKAIRGIEGVRDLHLLRTRQAGPDALVDVHVQVNPHISVSEGHRIAEHIRERLIHDLDEVSDVLVHIDTEDDQNFERGRTLPLRADVEARIRGELVGLAGAQAVQRVLLHYDADRIGVELHLPLAAAQDAADANSLAARLREATLRVPNVADVAVHFVT
ncbi:MAG: cation diffusion facilitator family transporter [Immundisolibacter sp.]|uniref:cation diffusion facilitator family transporter n=1 Tax=Immundisolibacter sp. TaxID=1934948 RepID=UPI003D11BC4E